MSDALDDAAAAALWALRLESIEHLGALYDSGAGIAASDTVSSGSGGRVKGTLRIPPGTLRGLFHNHPPNGRSRDTQRATFSRDDINQALQLDVPSYIGVDDEVLRYTRGDSPRGEPVLARFPIEEWRAEIMRKVLGREPDDPRGLMR